MHVDSLASYSSEISDCHFTLTQDRRAWLAELDANPAPLIDALGGKPPKRLGLYFEALWQFFLQQDPHTELIAHNLAVHDNGRTLGEFDCLYYDHARQQAVHLELAVKYFLGFHNTTSKNEPVLWYGPNRQDRLDLKLAHMLDRQIMLGEHSAARDRLKEIGITSFKREIVFHGYLFNAFSAALPYPEGHNKLGHGGRWLAVSDLEKISRGDAAKEFIILPRQRWLSPAVASMDDEILSSGQLQERMNAHFSEANRAQLITSLNGQGEERERFFVTPDAWPEIADP
jgi:hypothetical protein